MADLKISQIKSASPDPNELVLDPDNTDIVINTLVNGIIKTITIPLNKLVFDTNITTGIFVADTFEQMRLIDWNESNKLCWIAGRDTDDDGEGGPFIWKAGSELEDDGIFCAKPHDAGDQPGRWIAAH